MGQAASGVLTGGDCTSGGVFLQSVTMTEGLAVVADWSHRQGPAKAAAPHLATAWQPSDLHYSGIWQALVTVYRPLRKRYDVGELQRETALRHVLDMTTRQAPYSPEVWAAGI